MTNEHAYQYGRNVGRDAITAIPTYQMRNVQTWLDKVRKYFADRHDEREYDYFDDGIGDAVDGTDLF